MIAQSKALIERFDDWVKQPAEGTSNEAQQMAQFAREMRDALESHLPTEDDREALARIVWDSYSTATEVTTSRVWELVADAILAAGFCRSPVPLVTEGGTR